MIEIKNMSFGYGKNPIFKSFDLKIGNGETVLITGINGTGKTTLLRLMAGALLPKEGSVQYARELGQRPKAKIGFISDQMNLYNEMSLEEAAAFHGSLYGFTEFDGSLVDKLKIHRSKKLRDLSMGQRVLVHLSLILSARPEVILIDEVIHSIDAYLRQLFLQTLMELMAQRHVTIVMVHLNFHDIEKIPQRVILLKNGAIHVDEPIDDLKQKVKKVMTPEELTGTDIPVLLSGRYLDQYEYYIYPFEESHHREKLLRAVPGTGIQDLNLNDIISAFIGGEYV